jgi:hypothetical protein
VFTLYGIIREQYGWEFIFKCANYDCERTLNYSEPYFEIIQKGLLCTKCKKFTRDSEWNKNKRGYDEKCYNCGDEYFRPE